jgi:predicted dehydrogenase
VSELRVGVIGVNGIGQWHLYGLRNGERVTLTAVCDIDAARAEKASGDHGVPAFTDPATMYERGVVDAVIVATPPGTHGALVREALGAGIHVYCEKPIAPTSDEGYELARVATERGRVLHVGFQFRFHKGYAAIRDSVSELGPLFRVNLVATNWFRPQVYFEKGAWRQTWRVAGGGVLMNQAIHQLDALIATAGMPDVVRASVRRVRHRVEVEDDASALLTWSNKETKVEPTTETQAKATQEPKPEVTSRYEAEPESTRSRAGGASGVLVASLNDPAGRERMEFFGENGAVVLTDGYTIRRTDHEPAQRISDECPDEFPVLSHEWRVVDVPRAPSEWLDMLIDSHRDFAAAALDGHQSTVDGVSGTRSVELANAIYLSSLEDRAVTLPLTPGQYPSVFATLADGSCSINPLS